MKKELKNFSKYKHFKGEIYIVEKISNPTLIKDFLKEKYLYKTIKHTEKDSTINIYKIYEDEYNSYSYYHSLNDSEDKLVIYNTNSICNPISYGRPYYMFMSKIDPRLSKDGKQKYRFEEI